MKKVLSVILAIMMIASFVPMAFAEGECEHIFNTETLHRPGTADEKGYFYCSVCQNKVEVNIANYELIYQAVFDWTVVTENVYSFEKPYDTERIEYFGNVYQKFEDSFIDFTDSGIYTECEQEVLDSFAQILKSLTAELVSYFDELGAKKVIDVTEHIFYNEYLNVYVRLRYANDEINAVLENISQEFLEEIGSEDSYFAARAYLKKGYDDPSSVTQEEFNSIILGAKKYGDALLNCLSEKHNYYKATDNFDNTHSVYCACCQKSADIIETHTWGEYISNGDATTEADGTKTARCEKCQATDTVIDEGSKIKDKTSILYRDLIELIKMFINLLVKLFK